MAEIVTANRLGDGRVVFQTASGWSHEIARATLLDTAEAVAAALDRANADAAANLVVEPYAIAVRSSAEGPIPTRLRERIRAEGPTTGSSRHGDGIARHEAA
jgi:hypothetical protein